MTQSYSNSCTFNTLVLNVMAPILLRSISVPIMVTRFTGISAAVIKANITWQINQLTPRKILRPWNIVGTEQYLTLKNIIEFLQRPLPICHMLDRPTSLMNIRRFWNLIMVCRIVPQSGTILTQKMSGMTYQLPNRLLINDTICSVLNLENSNILKDEQVRNIPRIRQFGSTQ